MKAFKKIKSWYDGLDDMAQGCLCIALFYIVFGIAASTIHNAIEHRKQKKYEERMKEQTTTTTRRRYFDDEEKIMYLEDDRDFLIEELQKRTTEEEFDSLMWYLETY